MKEAPQDGIGLLGKLNLVERRLHQFDPAIPRRLIDSEGEVTHPQPGMSATLRIIIRPSKPLDEKIPQPSLGWGEVDHPVR